MATRRLNPPEELLELVDEVMFTKDLPHEDDVNELEDEWEENQPLVMRAVSMTMRRLGRTKAYRDPLGIAAQLRMVGRAPAFARNPKRRKNQGDEWGQLYEDASYVRKEIERALDPYVEHGPGVQGNLDEAMVAAKEVQDAAYDMGPPETAEEAITEYDWKTLDGGLRVLTTTLKSALDYGVDDRNSVESITGALETVRAMKKQSAKLKPLTPAGYRRNPPVAAEWATVGEKLTDIQREIASLMESTYVELDDNTMARLEDIGKDAKTAELALSELHFKYSGWEDDED